MPVDIPILKDVFPPIFLRLTPAAVLKPDISGENYPNKSLCAQVLTNIEDLDLPAV